MSDKSVDMRQRTRSVEEMQRLFGDAHTGTHDESEHEGGREVEALLSSDPSDGTDVALMSSVEKSIVLESPADDSGVLPDNVEASVHHRSFPNHVDNGRRRYLVNWVIVNYGLLILAIVFVIGILAYGVRTGLQYTSSDQTLIQSEEVVAAADECFVPSILPSPLDNRIVRPVRDSVQVFTGVGYGCSSIGSVDRVDRLSPLSGAIQGNHESWMLVEFTGQHGAGEGWIPLNDLVPIG